MFQEKENNEKVKENSSTAINVEKEENFTLTHANAVS